jgi:hypothetical protein
MLMVDQVELVAVQSQVRVILLHGLPGEMGMQDVEGKSLPLIVDYLNNKG